MKVTMATEDHTSSSPSRESHDGQAVCLDGSPGPNLHCLQLQDAHSPACCPGYSDSSGATWKEEACTREEESIPGCSVHIWSEHAGHHLKFLCSFCQRLQGLRQLGEGECRVTRLWTYEEEKGLMVMFCQWLAVVQCVWTYFTYSSFLPSYLGKCLS